MAMVYRTYQNRLFTSGSMDFDDSFNTHVLLRDLLKRLTTPKQIKYILVDEYQDTNQVQYMIKASRRYE